MLSGIGGFPDGLVWDEVPESGAGRVRASRSGTSTSPLRARLAAALEDVHDAGIAGRRRPGSPPTSPASSSSRTRSRLPVVSPRTPAERAGIVVLEPRPDQLTALTAALFNHGVSVTIRDGAVRIAPHAGTTEETLALLRSALLAYATALRPAGR